MRADQAARTAIIVAMLAAGAGWSADPASSAAPGEGAPATPPMPPADPTVPPGGVPEPTYKAPDAKQPTGDAAAALVAGVGSPGGRARPPVLGKGDTWQSKSFEEWRKIFRDPKAPMFLRLKAVDAFARLVADAEPVIEELVDFAVERGMSDNVGTLPTGPGGGPGLQPSGLLGPIAALENITHFHASHRKRVIDALLSKYRAARTPAGKKGASDPKHQISAMESLSMFGTEARALRDDIVRLLELVIGPGNSFPRTGREHVDVAGYLDRVSPNDADAPRMVERYAKHADPDVARRADEVLRYLKTRKLTREFEAKAEAAAKNARAATAKAEAAAAKKAGTAGPAEKKSPSPKASDDAKVAAALKRLKLAEAFFRVKACEDLGKLGAAAASAIADLESVATSDEDTGVKDAARKAIAEIRKASSAAGGEADGKPAP